MKGILTARATRFAAGAGLAALFVCGCPSRREVATPRPMPLEAERLAGFEYATLVTGGPPSEGLPLLVVLHSSGAGPSEFAHLFARLPVRARVLMPRGFARAHGGDAWWGSSADASPETDLRAIAENAGRLARFIAAAQEHYASSAPVVVTGISQGGDLSFALAMLYPDRVRAALPIAGRLPDALWPATAPGAAPPIDAFHGRADDKAPFAPTQAAVDALRARGLPIRMHAYDGLAHDTSPAEEGAVLACAARRLGGDLGPDACAASPH